MPSAPAPNECEHAAVSLKASSLPGCHVVEVGYRQAWVFVQFASPDTGSEARLYIDTHFSVGQVLHDERQIESRLIALTEMLGMTVSDARVHDDNRLVLVLEDLNFTVAGATADFTTGDT